MLSVIVPVYNAERDLARCLDSLLQQGVEDYEIICVNDGSTDGTANILQTYQQAHPSTIKVVEQKNSGLLLARNAGMSLAKGDVLAFCDADDYLAPCAYRFLLQTFWTDDIDVLKFNSITLDSLALKTWKEPHALQGNLLYEGMGREAMATHRAVLFFVWQNLYRRSFLQEHDIVFQPYAYCEDTAFGLDVYMHNPRVRMVSTNAYRYTTSENQLTRNRRPALMRRAVDSYCQLFLRMRDYADRCPGMASALAFYREQQVLPCISRLLSAKETPTGWHAVKSSLVAAGALPIQGKGKRAKLMNAIMANYASYFVVGVLYRNLFIPFILPRLSRN